MKNTFSAYNVFRVMHDNNIQFSYKGPLTQDILTSFGESIKEKLHTDDCDEKLIRRIFSILVETAQNILKYSTDRIEIDAHSRKDAGVGIIGIGNLTENEFLVFSGNIINRNSIPTIKTRIDFLNSLSPAELTLHYQKQLKEGTITADGSAGLGWIEIARKANRPMEYTFEELAGDEVFFEIAVRINVED
ncbi:MAG: hypothetical protein CVU50_09235 [Candidatus Cloacimonetes bacterium HGW-Cloacimonetes-3]|jgi:hypothetical protein|nr:MAG: hypothetical protein CVU50_09235 [Candidatus Cloacimonetes bacterium HGW-Cloacimonetes-3]